MLNLLNKIQDLNCFLKNKIILFLLLTILILFVAQGDYFAWILTILTTYHIMANNAVQIIGMFVASNDKKDKLKIWLLLSFIFVLTVLISWLFFDKQLHFSLLNSIQYNENLSILLIFLPIILYFFTKKNIPISATFLIIPIFSNNNTLQSMVVKTLISYFLSFTISFIFWYFLYIKYKNFIDIEKNNNKNRWIIIEYLSTAMLLGIWLVTSTCTFTIFLPRVFTIKYLILFIIVGIFSILVILYNDNTTIKKIIGNKSDINYKSGAIFNILFAMIMLSVQYISKIPITSTWVFLGVLAGRELAIAGSKKNNNSLNIIQSLKNDLSDLYSAILGIIFSLVFVKILLFAISVI